MQHMVEGHELLRRMRAVELPDGIDREKLAFVMDLKNIRRGRIRVPRTMCLSQAGGHTREW